jgi:hypothetical protein
MSCVDQVVIIRCSWRDSSPISKFHGRRLDEGHFAAEPVMNICSKLPARPARSPLFHLDAARWAQVHHGLAVIPFRKQSGSG